MSPNRSDDSSEFDVELLDVSKVYAMRNPVEALRSITLSVRAGEFISALGPSGCGKSTMLKLIAGLRMPTTGVIKVRGTHINSPYTGLGMVFETPVLLEWRNILRNILLQIEARGLRPANYRSRALELLQSVKLEGWEEHYPWELSAGMQQRVALCRALIHDPPLLLMDEPFGRLDALTREQLMLDLHRLWYKSRKTVVFVTHSIVEAVFLSDRVVVLTPRPGRIDRVISINIPHPRSLEVQDSLEFRSATTEIIQSFRRWGVLGD